jgi:hypothetical protein
MSAMRDDLHWANENAHRFITISMGVFFFFLLLLVRLIVIYSRLDLSFRQPFFSKKAYPVSSLQYPFPFLGNGVAESKIKSPPFNKIYGDDIRA